MNLRNTRRRKGLDPLLSGYGCVATAFQKVADIAGCSQPDCLRIRMVCRPSSKGLAIPLWTSMEKSASDSREKFEQLDGIIGSQSSVRQSPLISASPSLAARAILLDTGLVQSLSRGLDSKRGPVLYRRNHVSQRDKSPEAPKEPFSKCKARRLY